ncbi:uncharacterized protein BCR38DRAFT_482086 [Pseudomassariella vexata]|uniref:Uncharacterized protein n=1 Tax=Pseudomassariella vexata TaxID=1141098 RepID=A0A1Y2EAZ3_9PEZI|nr:uncharacterized protein BCR38DRAFT_482086 [Pseudomassariella vexata]ORY68587.1 hypothetical protein BCR38DRAFT_482086 [Pseudomassariella vexata]
MTNLASYHKFVDSIVEKHPEFHTFIINSGVQRHFGFNKPETVDLNIIQEEFTTNYVAYFHLIRAFLLHFLSQEVNLDTPSRGKLYVGSLRVRLRHNSFRDIDEYSGQASAKIALKAISKRDGVLNEKLRVAFMRNFALRPLLFNSGL